MKIHTKLFPIVVLALACGTGASADVLATYDFTGNPGTNPTAVNSTSAHLSASSISFGAGLTPKSLADTMGASTNDLGALSVGENAYWELTLTPDVGYQITIESISFAYLRSTNGAKNLVFRSSADNYAANASNALENIPTGEQNLSFTFDNTITDQNQSLTLRLYAYNPVSDTSAAYLRNKQLFTINGTITAVPEPAMGSLLLGLLGLGFAFSIRRSKR